MTKIIFDQENVELYEWLDALRKVGTDAEYDEYERSITVSENHIEYVISPFITKKEFEGILAIIGDVKYVIASIGAVSESKIEIIIQREGHLK